MKQTQKPVTSEQLMNAVTELKETAKELMNLPEKFDMADELTQEDCERGRICIMQSSSKLVKEDKARHGSFIDLTSMAELGYKEEKPLEFIPVGFIKYWVEVNAKNQEFISKYPAVHDREKLWEEEVNGILIKRLYTFSYLVVLPQDIVAKNPMVYELAFRSTELATVKKINATMMKMRRQGVNSWDKTFKLTLKLKTKGPNSWWGSEFALGRDTSAIEKQYAVEFRKEFLKLQNQVLNDTREHIESEF